MEDVTSIPSLHSDDSIKTHYDHGSEDLIKFRYCSILVQIEIASCFRNDVEPLFQLFDRLAKIPRKLYVLVCAVWLGADGDLAIRLVFRTSSW